MTTNTEKYNYNNFYAIVNELGLISTPIENELFNMNKNYLAIMKRKTVIGNDIKALEMIIEMATIAKEKLEALK